LRIIAQPVPQKCHRHSKVQQINASEVR